MEYLYAALLLHKAGQTITEETLKKTLVAAGVAVDDGRIKATVTALKDVDIEKVLSETTIAASAPAPAQPAAGGEAPATKEEAGPSPEEEKKTEEEAAAGLGALFG